MYIWNKSWNLRRTCQVTFGLLVVQLAECRSSLKSTDKELSKLHDEVL